MSSKWWDRLLMRLAHMTLWGIDFLLDRIGYEGSDDD
jgi:hypothetical protein